MNSFQSNFRKANLALYSFNQHPPEDQPLQTFSSKRDQFIDWSV
jgi:hypothetical protein